MPIQPFTLDALRREIATRSRGAFVRDHSGVFLVAMGVLSAETTVRDHAVREDSTLPLDFGDHPRHDLTSWHPLAGAVFLLQPGGQDAIRVGRSPQSEIVVPDDSVSEHHCCLQISAASVTVVDLDSTNGTSINQVRIPPDQPELLADGDLLTVGRYSFQLLSVAALHEMVLELAAPEES